MRCKSKRHCKRKVLKQTSWRGSWQLKFARAGTCPDWQVDGEAHFPRPAIHPARHVLHSELTWRDKPLHGIRGAVLPPLSFETIWPRTMKMRRALLFITILLLALVVARGVSAAPQRKASATLSGVVL